MITKAITAVANDQHQPTVVGYTRYHVQEELDLLNRRMLRYCSHHGLNFLRLYHDRGTPAPTDEWKFDGFNVLVAHLAYTTTKRVLVLDVDQLSRTQLDAVYMVGGNVYVLTAVPVNGAAFASSPGSTIDMREFEAALHTVHAPAAGAALERADPGNPATDEVLSTASAGAPSIGCSEVAAELEGPDLLAPPPNPESTSD